VADLTPDPHGNGYSAVVRIVIAVDKFAGTLTAPEAARAIAEGWGRARPGDEIVSVPMADGGPGFLDALVAAGGGDERLATVSGPLGEAVTARYLVRERDSVLTAYIEVAEACGLHLVPEEAREPLRATSYGVGELVSAALEDGARRIVLGLGGTCTTDGGAGLLAALGAEPGDVLRGGGGALRGLEALELGVARERLDGVEVVVASDVDNPLLGLRGAAAVFGPQKGASADDVQRLDAALTRFAELAGALGQEAGAVRRTLDAPGAGAGGGLGYGLMLVGGRRVAGIGTVIEETGLAGLIAGADLVVTGEGKLDHSSLGGKVPSGVAQAALGSGRPCVVLAGRVEVGKRELAAAGFAGAYEVVEEAGSVEAAMGDAALYLGALAERVARSWSR
jgi:glycerate 2-kinase